MELIKQFELAQKQLSTIRDVIRFMVSKFNEHNLSYGHGTTNAYDEAVYLILDTLNLPIDQLEPYFDAKLLDFEMVKLMDAGKRRIIDRLPAPYITNKANFMGYEFYVDNRVIVPRSFIGELILNNTLDEYIEYPELVHNILDLCTGNGSISIIAAEYFYDSDVIASDIDGSALDVAQININKYSLHDKIKLVQSNLFENLTQYKNSFDLILTNPPYVDTNNMGLLPQEFIHEPNHSLAGGEDGLELIDVILKHSKEFLTEFGILVVEMGNNQAELENKYYGLNFKWLNTTNDSGFVFLLTKKDLDQYFD